MALVKCIECSGTVSTKAQFCPHCGAKTKPTYNFAWLGFMAALVPMTFYVATLVYIYGLTDPNRHLRWEKALDSANTVTLAMRDPSSLQWEKIRADNNGSLICMEYRAKNGFGALNKEKVFSVNGVYFDKDSDWQIFCGDTAKEMPLFMFYLDSAARKISDRGLLFWPRKNTPPPPPQ